MTETKRILLVDNDPADVELTTIGLAQAGLSNIIDVVHEANDALDYLHWRGKFKDRVGGFPVVILLDLKLPGMDGRELLKHLKTEEKINCIPVVVFTGSQSEQDILKTYAYGANSYVIKPFNYQELLNVIREVGLYWTVVSESPPVSKCVV